MCDRKSSFYSGRKMTLFSYSHPMHGIGSENLGEVGFGKKIKSPNDHLYPWISVGNERWTGLSLKVFKILCKLRKLLVEE